MGETSGIRAGLSCYGDYRDRESPLDHPVIHDVESKNASNMCLMHILEYTIDSVVFEGPPGHRKYTLMSCRHVRILGMSVR